MVEEGAWDGEEGDRRYLAPEVLQDKATTKADIFSAGLIVYQVLCGVYGSCRLYSLLSKTRLYVSEHVTRPPFSVSVVRRAIQARLDERNRNSSHVGMARALSPNHPSAPSSSPSRTQMLMGIHELPGNGEEWQSLRRAEPDNMQLIPACPEHESLAKVSFCLSLLPCARFFFRSASLSDHHPLALPSLSTLSLTLALLLPLSPVLNLSRQVVTWMIHPNPAKRPSAAGEDAVVAELCACAKSKPTSERRYTRQMSCAAYLANTHAWQRVLSWNSVFVGRRMPRN